VGKVVMRAAAEHLTPVLLELGGQNPAIVDETANVPDAAKKIVWGAMAWGGQWCTSPGYAVVHESVAEEFVAECRKAVVELYGSDPKSNSDYSRIISAAAVEKLASLIDLKKVVYGGKFDAPARYLDRPFCIPFPGPTKSWKMKSSGCFCILTFSDLGKSLEKIKSLPKPLAGYVFSRNQPAIDRVLQSLSFGGGAVNQTNIFLFIESMPYGGVGTSGIGNYYGKYGYDSLTHAKSILISPPDIAVDHLFRLTPEKRFKHSINRLSIRHALNKWSDY
jgi:aldehyde dehydrogenase (NAD+)